jgi:hypothetical protein
MTSGSFFQHMQRGLVAIFFCGVFARHTAIFYPGYIPADTLYMLSMGLGREPLSNWHPPAVSLALGGLYLLVQHIGVIWLMQSVCFLTWIRLNSSLYHKTSTALASALVFAAWPPLITNLATLWKDSWAVIATLYLFWAAKQAMSQRGRSNVLLGMTFGVIAITVRPDYLPVVIPLVGAAVWAHFADSSTRQKAKSLLVGVASVILCVISIRMATGLLVQKQVNPWTPTAVWDAAGARVCDPSNRDGLTLAGRTLTRDELVAAYRTTSSDALVFGLGVVNLPQAPALQPVEAEKKECRQLWWDAVVNRTHGYLRHRWAFAKVFLGIDTTQVHAPYAFGVTANSFGFTFDRTPANIAAYWIFDPLAHGLLWRLWLYVVAAIGIAAVSAVRHGPVLVLPLALSVMGALARVVILPAADFRYGLWVVCGTLLLALEFWDSLRIPRMYAPLTPEDLIGRTPREPGSRR